MILITTYYNSDNEERREEIKKCLLKNNENKYIEKIYLLNDKIYDLDMIVCSNKIEQIIISNENNYKLKFSDAIKFINENLTGNICILSNSDIYFDETLSKINNMDNKCYALLRYDEVNDTKEIFTRHGLPRNDSQDSWIFKSPIQLDLNEIDFSFGTLGSDSIFAKKIYDSKIELSNPSLDIIITHVHNSNFRTYKFDECIHGLYCLIKPTYLNEKAQFSFLQY